MNRHLPRTPMSLLVLAAVGGAVALSGCSVEDDAATGAAPASSGSGSAEEIAVLPLDPELQAAVPAAFTGRTLAFAVSEYSPYATYASDGSIEGLMPDLATQLSSMLGVEIEMQKSTFDAVVPGIQSGRIDLSGPAGDFVERQANVTFADFAQSNVTVMVNTSAGFSPAASLDMCGHSAGIEKGAGTQNVLDAVSTQCTEGGKEPVDIQTFNDLPAAALALQSGRLESVVAPSASNEVASANSGGTFETIEIEDMQSLPSATAVYGIQTPKDSGLAEALVPALQELYDQGTYQQLLDKWDLSLSAVTRDQIAVDGSTQTQAR